MAVIEARSQDKLNSYLELYCEPLSREEEIEIDQEVVQLVIKMLPKEAGFTYDELCEQAELVRDPDDTPLPLWFWTAWLVGSKASKALENDPDLENRVSKFSTYMFGDYLNKEWRRRELVYGTWAVAPFAFIEGTAGGHRLYRLRNEAATPDEVLNFFGRERQILKIATHSYTGPMRRLLLDKKQEARSEQVKVRENGKVKEREVEGRLALPEGAQLIRAPEAYLQELTHVLLKHRDTSLLKVHLDLTNQAFAAKSNRPIFSYDLTQAAKRLGSALQSHGAYHSDTLRSIYTRALALNFHRIDIYEVKDKRRSKLVIRSPFWIIRNEGYAQAGDILDDSNLPLLLTDENAPIVKLLILEPGDWWQAAGMSQGYYFHLPSSLLRLPTDSRSETNHIAVRLAAELAVWERTNQRGEPQPIFRQIGALLERAGVATFDSLKSGHREQQKRLRKYLVGDDGDAGAFGILRSHGAFDIDIEDEAAFWASNRGWFKKFWEARIRLSVRPYSKALEE